MEIALFAVLALVAVGSLGGALRHRVLLRGLQEQVDSLPTPSETPPVDLSPVRAELDALGSRLTVVEEFKGTIIAAVDEGIRDVKRREGRIHATVRRASEELEQLGFTHPGVEAEARELQLLDGGGGEDEEMHAVPESVEASGEDTSQRDFSAFPGDWTGVA